MTAETQDVRHRDVDRALAGYIWYIVQVTIGIGMVQVDGRGNNACLNGHNRDHCFNGTGGSQGMSGHRFGGTDGQAISMIAKTGFMACVSVLSLGGVEVPWALR